MPTRDDLIEPELLDVETFIREQAERHVRVQIDDKGMWSGTIGGITVRHFGIDERLARHWMNVHSEAVRKIVRDALTLVGYISDVADFTTLGNDSRFQLAS